MSKATKLVIGLLLIAVLALSFGTGYILGGKPSRGSGTDVEIIGQAWDVIFSDYVDKSQLDSKNLKRAAIEGMITALDDPYTSYLDTQDYQLGQAQLQGQFEGIGAYVGMKDNKITIIAPFEGSPAARAGIKAGDIILEIDGLSTDNLSINEAVFKIRGPQGTPVKLLILHEGDSKPEAIEVVRGQIEVPSVHFEMKEDIAYINIMLFSERTDTELSTVLENATRQGAKSIILDLRSNPGGLLETVINVASYFLKEGVVVSVVSNEEKTSSSSVKPDFPTTYLPMVVLTDNYSASGIEVLSGALQDYGRAVIAGTKTFGKGSVDILRQLADGSGIYITTARWLTPKGRLIEGKGIEPDIRLELKGDEAIQWAIDYLKSKR